MRTVNKRLNKFDADDDTALNLRDALREEVDSPFADLNSAAVPSKEEMVEHKRMIILCVFGCVGWRERVREI